MWNNNGLNEDDRKALSTISTKPPLPTLKLHSLNPQHLNKLHLQHHNHSFDEQTISSLNYEHPTFNNHARYDHSISLPLSNLSLSVDSSPVLPEFTASGGTGIFKAPTRSAVHPSRPPALELRPHPLRETQVGRFLRTIGCTETQIWAGQESGVRFWMIKDAYQHGCGLGGRIRRGDEDAAPFYESGNKTSPTLCMEVDHGNKLVWTGHKDGRIRSWKMDVDVSGDDSTKFEEGLSWSAHKGPVLAMLISSYGDIWSGSEGGVIKIWPWETVEKSLSMSPEEKHISSFLVERTFIDLRSQVTVNGVCNISSSDIKAILSDHARGRVWCATSLSFSLWDARTKELIKVFNIDGQIENRVEMPVPQDQAVPPQEDEMKVKFVYQPSKKEKSHNFLKRSKNAIMGAAGAVRRVASRGASTFNEESKKTEAMVLTSDGTIWSGCSNGLLIQWDWNGNRIQDLTHHPRPVLCFCTYGSKLWVGYASGVIQLLDLDGNIIAGWVAHSSPVIKMAIGGGYVFSMAIHGGIRGWHITSPGPIDNMLRTELAAKEELYTRHESFKILVGTWNVGQGKPPHEGLKSWLGSAASDVGIVVVGLQEVGMGAGFLAMAAAKETVGLEGSAIGQLWQDAIGRVLGEGLVFERVGSRQLAGLLIAIWVKKNLRPYVGDLDVAAVACGFGRTIGNKGGVGLRLRVHDRIICFVNCHLAAHLEAVNRRNSDFDHIFRTMVFSRQTNLMNVAAGMRCLLFYCSLAFSIYLFWLLYTSGFPFLLSLAAGATCASLLLRTVNGSSSGNSDEGRPDLSQADMVIFCGDFNYRLFGITYDEARDVVSQRSFDWLREKDQLRAEMKDGKVFQGMHEAEIRFPPTYKFEKYKPGLGGYDSGEKKRIPAWCDRVIYRDCRNGPVTECNLSCPIISSVHMYEACMDVNDSDHKPVRCKLNVRLARVDRSIRRKEFGKIMNNNDQLRTLLRDLSNVPETSISTDKIVLQNQETCTLCISNKSQIDKAIVRVVCEGQRSVHGNQDSTGFRPRGSFGFPPWLQITPASGIIKPEESVEILVHHADFQTSGDSAEGVPQNWWSEDTRDKEVILSVQVRGCYSIEAKTHIIHIRHCYSALSVRIESRTSSSRRGSNGSHHWHDNNFDVCDRG